MGRCLRFGASLLAGLSLLLCGCGQDLAFRRPRLIRPGRTPDELVLFDYAGHRIMVVDRRMKLLRMFTHSLFDNLWGMDTSDRHIVVANQRSLGFSHTPEEKRQMAVAEIMVFDYQGTLVRHHAWTGETGPIVDPRNIMLYPDGTFLVGDIRLNRLVHLDADGRLLRTIATYGFDPGQLFYPNDTRLTPKGELLVVDAFNSRLQLFDPDGAFLRIVAESGEEPGRLRFPQVAAIGPQGRIYCSELATMRLSEFDPDLTFRRTIAPPGSEAVQLFGVCALASPAEIFAADIRNSRILVFGESGDLLRSCSRAEP